MLFDLDGVLVDSTDAVEESWRWFARHHRLDAERLLDGLHGRRMVDIVAGALPDVDANARRQAAAELEAVEAATAEGTVLLPGAARALSQLDGALWAIATSGTERIATSRLRAVGLTVPPVLITAEDVDAGKPAPDVYLLAAERLGVEPGRCVVVEDAPAGLQAARAAGCATVGLATSHATEELIDADRVVPSLDAVTISRDGEGLLTLTFADTSAGDPSPAG